MGQLASSQDEDNWLSRVDERRANHCGPSMLEPLVDIFIANGDLPAPKNGKYIIKWPDLISLSDEKLAVIAVQKAQALATYSNALGAELLVTPQQFVEEVLGMEYREDEIAQLELEQAAEDEANAQAQHEQELELAKAQGKLPVLVGPGGKPIVKPTTKPPFPTKA